MDFIRTKLLYFVLAVLVTLQASWTQGATYYTTNIKTTWSSIPGNCSLATPKLIYNKGGQLQIEDQLAKSLQTQGLIGTDGPLWIGYYQTYRTFAYIGCVEEQEVSISQVDKHTFSTDIAPGICSNVCNTKFFGLSNVLRRSIPGSEKKSCFCYGDNRPNPSYGTDTRTGCCMAGFVGCSTSRDRVKVFESLDDYSTSSSNLNQLWYEACLRYEPVQDLEEWTSCTNGHRAICMDSNGNLDTSLMAFGDNWFENANRCFEAGAYPVTRDVLLKIDVTVKAQIWTSMFRNLVTRSINDDGTSTVTVNAGLYIKQATNSQVIEASTLLDQNTEYKALCTTELPSSQSASTSPTMSSAHVTELPSSQSASTSPTMSSAHVTQHHMSEEPSGSGAGIAVGVSVVVIVLAGTIVVCIVLWKRGLLGNVFSKCIGDEGFLGSRLSNKTAETSAPTSPGNYSEQDDGSTLQVNHTYMILEKESDVCKVHEPRADMEAEVDYNDVTETTDYNEIIDSTMYDVIDDVSGEAEYGEGHYNTAHAGDIVKNKRDLNSHPGNVYNKVDLKPTRQDYDHVGDIGVNKLNGWTGSNANSDYDTAKVDHVGKQATYAATAGTQDRDETPDDDTYNHTNLQMSPKPVGTDNPYSTHTPSVPEDDTYNHTNLQKSPKPVGTDNPYGSHAPGHPNHDVFQFP